MIIADAPMSSGEFILSLVEENAALRARLLELSANPFMAFGPARVLVAEGLADVEDETAVILASLEFDSDA